MSEFILYPTATPTEIGQPEMARVLKPGGSILITDVITTQTIPPTVRRAWRALGLDYLCEATSDDFRCWMLESGLHDVDVCDYTALVRQVWEKRRLDDINPKHAFGYHYLLDDPNYSLGASLFYIYVSGKKPE